MCHKRTFTENRLTVTFMINLVINAKQLFRKTSYNVLIILSNWLNCALWQIEKPAPKFKIYEYMI